jgi:hypothetical protein
MTSNTATRWRKSTWSEGEDACVEVDHGISVVGVRDSKNADAGHQRISRTAWGSFVDGIRRGEFDLRQ